MEQKAAQRPIFGVSQTNFLKRRRYACYTKLLLLFFMTLLDRQGFPSNKTPVTGAHFYYVKRSPFFNGNLSACPFSENSSMRIVFLACDSCPFPREINPTEVGFSLLLLGIVKASLTLPSLNRSVPIIFSLRSKMWNDVFALA